MDKKLLRNYIYNIMYQLVKIVFPLITVPFLYKTIGAGTLGISDFASNIAAWFILFGILGINTYGNRQIAKVRNNKDELSNTFFEIFSIQLINMLIANILYFIYINLTVKENIDIYYLTGFTLLATTFDITWFFYGIEDFKKASIRNIAVKVASVALIFIFIRKPEDLWLYVVFNSCGELFGQIIMFTQLNKHITFKWINIKNAYRKHLKPTFLLFLPTIAISVYTLLDQTMLGYLDSTTSVNYYKTSMSIIKMFLYFITAIGEVVLPRVTNVYYNEDNGEQKIKQLINKTMKIAMILALPMCFGMMAISQSFISWYIPSAPIIGYLIAVGCPIIVFISMSNVTGIQFMVPTGMYNKYTLSVVCGSVVNFIANCILIPYFGALGAIIGSIIAEFTVTVVQLIFVYREKKITFLSISYLKYLIASIVMFVVVYNSTALINSIISSGIITNIIQAAIGVIVYFLLLIILREELIIEIVNKILNKKECIK